MSETKQLGTSLTEIAQSVEAVTSPTNQLIDQFFKRLEEFVSPWDVDGNKRIDANEATKGTLKTLKFVAMCISLLGIVYSTISGAVGYIENEINWIAIFMGVGLFIVMGILYFVFKIQGEATSNKIDSMIQEYKTDVNQINTQWKSKYEDLKSRFVSYKTDAEKQIQDLQVKYERILEEKFQIWADDKWKSVTLKTIQDQNPNLKLDFINP